MKKLLLIGRSGSGKTTLTQALRGQKVQYQKTQGMVFEDFLIDSPGEYAENPDITRIRMYYETISEVLPGVKVYINTGDSNSVDMLLPLESLVGGN